MVLRAEGTERDGLNARGYSRSHPPTLNICGGEPPRPLAGRRPAGWAAGIRRAVGLGRSSPSGGAGSRRGPRDTAGRGDRPSNCRGGGLPLALRTSDVDMIAVGGTPTLRSTERPRPRHHRRGRLLSIALRAGGVPKTPPSGEPRDRSEPRWPRYRASATVRGLSLRPDVLIGGSNWGGGAVRAVDECRRFVVEPVARRPRERGGRIPVPDAARDAGDRAGLEIAGVASTATGTRRPRRVFRCWRRATGSRTARCRGHRVRPSCWPRLEPRRRNRRRGSGGGGDRR